MKSDTTEQALLIKRSKEMADSKIVKMFLSNASVCIFFFRDIFGNCFLEYQKIFKAKKFVLQDNSVCFHLIFF